MKKPGLIPKQSQANQEEEEEHIKTEDCIELLNHYLDEGGAPYIAYQALKVLASRVRESEE